MKYNGEPLSKRPTKSESVNENRLDKSFSTLAFTLPIMLSRFEKKNVLEPKMIKPAGNFLRETRCSKQSVS